MPEESPNDQNGSPAEPGTDPKPPAGGGGAGEGSPSGGPKPTPPPVDWQARARSQEKQNRTLLGELDETRSRLSELEGVDGARTQALSELEAAREEARNAAAQAQEAQLSLARHRVAVEAGIPQFADRLQGANDEELKADAEKLRGQLSHPGAGDMSVKRVGGDVKRNREALVERYMNT